MSEPKNAIPAEAVEAAVRRLGESVLSYRDAKAALEAATPHMQDRLGEGDYLPGWDDRKTLAGVWQEHVPLPNEGLTDGVYEALIAVAQWGYEQRRLEAE